MVNGQAALGELLSYFTGDHQRLRTLTKRFSMPENRRILSALGFQEFDSEVHVDSKDFPWVRQALETMIAELKRRG